MGLQTPEGWQRLMALIKEFGREFLKDLLKGTYFYKETEKSTKDLNFF